MRRLGEFPTEEELRVMVDQVDQVCWMCTTQEKNWFGLQDKNGSIELDEFLMMMATRLKMNEKIKEVFKVFDQNNDG
jgi:Ca2+-binding EF-hand superfamily protein